MCGLILMQLWKGTDLSFLENIHCVATLCSYFHLLEHPIGIVFI